jgi:hypothetical protein
MTAEVVLMSGFKSVLICSSKSSAPGHIHPARNRHGLTDLRKIGSRPRREEGCRQNLAPRTNV